MPPKEIQFIEPSEIKRIRKRYSLTQKDFGSLLGVQATTITKWESDHNPDSPSPYTASLIKALDGAKLRTGRYHDLHVTLEKKGAIATLVKLLRESHRWIEL